MLERLRKLALVIAALAALAAGGAVIAGAHGGEARVRSVPDEGSTFSVTLPTP